MEASPRVLAKKLWSIVRIAFFMIRKGISKNKIMAHLHKYLMNKRGKISAKVIIGSLMFHHHNHHTASVDIPREYEFSCSNSPSSFHFTNKGRKTHRRSSVPTVTEEEDEDVTVVNAVQKLMEMLNNDGTTTEASSPVNLPWFGCSTPMMNVRQLRITDSPFPLKEADEDSSRIDKDAEEFIQRFYAQLRLQNNMAAACT